jgi:hypothetical protein
MGIRESFRQGRDEVRARAGRGASTMSEDFWEALLGHEPKGVRLDQPPLNGWLRKLRKCLTFI